MSKGTIWLVGGFIAGVFTGIFLAKRNEEREVIEEKPGDEEDYRRGRTPRDRNVARPTEDYIRAVERAKRATEDDDEMIVWGSDGTIYTIPVHDEEDESIEEHVRDEGRRERANSGKEPKIISREAFDDILFNDPTWDHQVLNYYVFNNRLTEEDGDEILVPYDVIGDSLVKYGFADNEETVMFVQNFEYHTIYEVDKLYLFYYSEEE